MVSSGYFRLGGRDKSTAPEMVEHVMPTEIQRQAAASSKFIELRICPKILTGWWFGTMEFYDFPFSGE